MMSYTKPYILIMKSYTKLYIVIMTSYANPLFTKKNIQKTNMHTTYFYIYR